MSASATFDPLGPLPRGRLAIEAGAGTGKTYALANLALRYIVEDGVAVTEVLVVTFTRAAAAELRDRVRRRLTEAVEALTATATSAATTSAIGTSATGTSAAATEDPGGVPTSTDEVLTSLCSSDVVRRRDRAVTALADFDAANIMTIHGFAQQALVALGGNAPGDPDAVLVDDLTAQLRQVGSDVLVRAALSSPGGDEPSASDPEGDGAARGELPTLTKLEERVREVVGNPGIRIVPSVDPAESNPDAARHRQLVDEMVDEIGRRRRRAGTLSYDDLMSRLHAALVDPTTGSAARDVIRRRICIALVDEFQDTDPVQWDIFRLLFGDPDSATALVLVGDPKQAIYGFRGANVQTYLEAVEAPGTARAVLDTNWRSDGALLSGLEALLTGATFGDSRIAFGATQPVDFRRSARLTRDDAAVPAVSIRLAVAEALDRTTKKLIRTDAAVGAIADDLSRAVRELLETGRIPESDGRGGTTRPVRPNDIAVLVGSHAESPVMRDALARLRIPAVIARGETVMTSPAAHQWRQLLDALAQPADPGRARTAALSWFVGWSADELVGADDRCLAPVQERLQRWSDVLVADGIAEFRRIIWTESGVSARVLAAADGDRSMTDLDHIAELLARHAPRQTGPVGLLAAFDQLTLDTDLDEVEVEVAARRVESDDDAIQIMTVHAAKGLEFGIVCIPTLWRSAQVRTAATIFRDPVGGERTIDVANNCQWPTRAAAGERHGLARAESVGQSLRLLYVALTRARHRSMVWWSRCSGSDGTGLARVLFARDEGGIDPDAFVGAKVALPVDEDAAARLDSVVERSDASVEVTVIGDDERPTRLWAHHDTVEPIALAEARLDRPLDRRRRRWSFSALTADAPVVADPLDGGSGDAGAADEGEIAADPEHGTGSVGAAVGRPASVEVELVLGSMTGGTTFGTLVHDVLERVDFAAPALQSELDDAIAEAVVRRGLEIDRAVLTEGLSACLHTPLGPLLDDRKLVDFPRADRLDELDFELHLATGGPAAPDSELGALVARHLPADDPLRAWAEDLAHAGPGHLLAGHLVGSIDAVLRVADPAGGPARFAVVDYKTNRLGRPGTEPCSADYQSDRLPAAMTAHDYPLQALLYSAALHRYLRWRLADYDPAIHLGGIAYLFVRGMTGPDTPRLGDCPNGVFAWRPPAELVTELSDLLDGRYRSEDS